MITDSIFTEEEFDLEKDIIHDECGVFGITTVPGSDVNVAGETQFGLYALQHRGQESCGICVNDRGVMTTVKDVGLVPEVFTLDVMEKFPLGQMAIGHVRYAPKEQSSPVNAQPLVVRHAKGTLVLAHNGNLVNGVEIREELRNQGVIFHTTNDTEVISYLIAKERLTASSIEEAIERAMEKLEGSYSLLIMSPRKMIAARDPHGFRPLCIGTLKGGYVFASETCALDSVGAKFLRDVEPGEIVEVVDGELKVYKKSSGPADGLCVFEYVYFARPDSVIEGASVHEARKQAGRFLAKSHPVDADIVCGVPDSGLDAAMGYAEESGIPYGVGLLKNRYIGRTFIQPLQSQRENSVKIKLNPIADTVRGKRVVLVDDSIVRGTTSARIVKLLREAGAKEIHLRLSSPPFINECYFGTDIDNKKNLIACRMSMEEMRESIGADSLGFLNIEDAKCVAKGCKAKGFCLGCFTGEYPICVEKALMKDKFDEKLDV